MLRLRSDYQLHPVKEYGPGGWMTATQYLAADSPANWKDEEVKLLLDVVEATMNTSINEQNLRAMVIRKKRGIGTIPKSGELISREALDETVLRCQDELSRLHNRGGINLPFCAFNGGRDVWVDVGNKRVGVKILQSYLGIPVEESLHIGDQFLNTVRSPFVSLWLCCINFIILVLACLHLIVVNESHLPFFAIEIRGMITQREIRVLASGLLHRRRPLTF